MNNVSSLIFLDVRRRWERVLYFMGAFLKEGCAQRRCYSACLVPCGAYQPSDNVGDSGGKSGLSAREGVVGE